MPVNSPHPSYTAFTDKWERCRDASDGQDAVHSQGEKYLPKLKTQDPTEFASYVKRTPFYNATWRTIAGLTGMLFRKPPKIEVPETLKLLLEDVDLAGQPLQLFMQDVSENVLKYGRVGVLVDYPPSKPGLTLADERRQNLRPSMQIYGTFSILNWKKGSVKNRTVGVMYVLKESKSVPEDEFLSKDEERWRVLDLIDGAPDASGVPSKVYRQRLFKMKGGEAAKKLATKEFELDVEFGNGGIVYPMMAGVTMDTIPFRVIGPDSVSLDVDEPPLIDLVDVNLSHYRTTADLEHGCHFTALPMLFLSGFKAELDANHNEKKVYVGSEQAIITSNVDADGKYIEFTGTGLASLERRLDRKEQQMAILGARMLEVQKKAVEAAETASIHRKGEESMLASVSMAISLGMTECLRWFAQWASMDHTKVLVELNKDFFPAGMTPQMLTALISGWQQGAPGLSDQGLFNQLKVGEIVADDVTLEEEQARQAEQQQRLVDQQVAAQAAFAASQADPNDPGAAV